MKTIHRYSIKDKMIPKGAKFISAVIQNGNIMLYAEVDPSAEREERTFNAIGTGWDVKDDFFDKNDFITTLVDDSQVWHIYIQKQEVPAPKNGDCPVCGGHTVTSDPNEMPYIADCTVCKYHAEVREEGVILFTLMGKSYFIDPAAGEETNIEILSRLNQAILQVRKDME